MQRLEEEALQKRLLDRPQPLWILPTFSFWKGQNLGWLAVFVALGIGVGTLPATTPLGAAALALASIVVVLGMLERLIRHRVKSRNC
jgi:hypothetical protein